MWGFCFAFLAGFVSLPLSPYSFFLFEFSVVEVVGFVLKELLDSPFAFWTGLMGETPFLNPLLLMLRARILLVTLGLVASGSI